MTTPQQAARPRTIRLRGVAMRATVFLLLGAIVNIAVAWGCASFARAETTTRFNPVTWSNFRPSGWPTVPTLRWRTEGVGMTVQFDDANGPAPSGHWEGDKYVGQWNSDLYRFAWFTVGWPSRSMQWSLYDKMPDARGTLDFFPTKTHGMWVSGFDPPKILPDEWRMQRRLPLAPLWPGFAINTFFYATTLWLLVAAPFALRRRQRSKRGMCPACAYPIGTSDLCTECGASLSATSTTLR